MFWKAIKIAFYVYVITLAVYTTFKNLRYRRMGSYQETVNPVQSKCEQGGESWRFCVFTSPDEDPTTILYFFHGRGENEMLWAKPSQYGAQLQNHWQRYGGRQPKVVSISLGDTWIISPKLSQKNTGLLELFRDEIFPKIESQTGVPKARYLLGSSMGGLNVLTLALHMPRQFQKVAAICPPLAEISPYASYSELMAYGVANGVRIQSYFELLMVGRAFVANDQEWELFSPLHVLNRTTYNYFPHTYLSSGMHDQYGNFHSVRRFAELLHAKTNKVHWRANSGGHCSVDIPSLTQFLTVSTKN